MAADHPVLDHSRRLHCNSSSLLRRITQTPHRLKKRMLATWTPDQELNQVRERSGADMKRKLEWYDLLALGVGGMLGAGVFVTTGHVARNVAGPAVFVSYLVAGVSALLSSMCYTEFSVEIPVAGGAFSYLRVTFGEFVGYLGGANLLMEYVLSNAAVARSFTEYLSSAVGVGDANAWRLEVEGLAVGYNRLDFPAVALILLLTLCLCHSCFLDAGGRVAGVDRGGVGSRGVAAADRGGVGAGRGGSSCWRSQRRLCWRSRRCEVFTPGSSSASASLSVVGLQARRAL